LHLLRVRSFEKVTAVVFVVAMSEYDQRLFEDESQNRLYESLDLFDETCNSRWYARNLKLLLLSNTLRC
jgi:guanine nucleotide-binding protein G(i) subunit alpha